MTPKRPPKPPRGGDGHGRDKLESDVRDAMQVAVFHGLPKGEAANILIAIAQDVIRGESGRSPEPGLPRTTGPRD